jgi:hypothetical protein
MEFLQIAPKLLVCAVLLSGMIESGRAQAPNESAQPTAARDRANPVDGSKGAAEQPSITLHLIGAHLRDDVGSPVGRIENLLVDPESGRIELLLVTPDFPTNTTKILPVPWKALTHRADESGMGSVRGANQVFALSFSRSKLQHAPTFERYRWPNLSDAAWRRTIYDFYSVENDRPTGATGNGSRVSSGTGSSAEPANVLTNSPPVSSNEFIGPRLRSAPDQSRPADLSPEEVQRRRDSRNDSALPIGARR